MAKMTTNQASYQFRWLDDNWKTCLNTDQNESFVELHKDVHEA